MRPQRSYLDYLVDILEATNEELVFVQGMTFLDFANDRRTNLAVVRSLEIIGEAARQIPVGVRRRWPEVAWEDMVAMRNKLIHGYFGVDLEVIWRTIEEDLPNLRDSIKSILEALEND